MASGVADCSILSFFDTLDAVSNDVVIFAVFGCLFSVKL